MTEDEDDPIDFVKTVDEMSTVSTTAPDAEDVAAVARDDIDRFYEFFPGAKRILVEEVPLVEDLLNKAVVASGKKASSAPAPALIREIAQQLVTAAYREPPIVGEKAQKKLLALQEAAKAVEADFLAHNCIAEVLSWQEMLAISRIARLDVSPNRRGARRKEEAARVATCLAHHFKMLTGSPPGRSVVTTPDGQRTGGRFVRLLAEIYRALKIDAKADSQAKTRNRAHGKK